MARRFFLSPIVRVEQVDTDPVTGETETTVRYLPKAARRMEQQFAGVAGVTINSLMGTLKGQVYDPPFALVRIDAPDFGDLLVDAEIDTLPDFPLAGKLNAMQNQTRNRMMARLAARGIDVSALGTADGYEDLIEQIGKRVRPEFGKHLTSFFS